MALDPSSNVLASKSVGSLGGSDPWFRHQGHTAHIGQSPQCIVKLTAKYVNDTRRFDTTQIAADDDDVKSSDVECS